LQDQTLAFGPAESRYVEEKRHYEKPIPISELVFLDRERCILCDRCTRFASEVAGDPLIHFTSRGNNTQVNTFPDEPFASYFSGNTVQICPVGALTAKPYRFKARPWDLASIETTCQTCSVGCRGSVESSSNRVVRMLGVDVDPTNHGWLCDKGRFGIEAVHADDRVRTPMIRRDGALVECSWPEALDVAAAGIQRSLDLHGAGSVAVIGGARGTNEDAYAWARLAKGVIGTDHVDAQLGDGLPAELVLGLPGATIPDLDRAAAIVLLAPDLKEELPVLYLRVRRAAVDLGVPLVDVSALDHGLSKYAAATVPHLPGEQATAARDVAAALAPLTEGRTGSIVVILGRPDVATAADATVAAAGVLRDLPDARFLMALRRGNVRGALELGLAPGVLPGRVSLEDGTARFTEAWGRVPAARGLDTVGILGAASEGRIGALVLLGADVTNDVPDRQLARAGVRGAGFVVAVDATLTEAAALADVVLPAAVWGEKSGTTTNLEGRVQRVGRKVSPDGSPMTDWRIAGELALRLGTDFDLEDETELQDEIATVAPAFAEVDAVLVRRARDGVVLPVADHRDELVLEARRIPVTDFSWEPIAPEAEVVEVVETEVVVEDAEGDVEVEEIVEIVATGLPAAAAITWNGAEARPTPGRDNYALRLIAGRRLYDAGRTVSASPSLVGLVPEASLRVNPQEISRIGVSEGDQVRITTSRGTQTLALTGDAALPLGVAVMTFNLPGVGVGDLVDATSVVTDLRVETVR
jgi:NADH-quinone oxidoreductase subunit G